MEFRMGSWGITDSNDVMSQPSVNAQAVIVQSAYMIFLWSGNAIMYYIIESHYIHTLLI